MGTPANIVLVKANGNVLGARVNYDGYPSHIGPFLATVLARPEMTPDVLASVLAAGIEWSSLDADQEVTGSQRYREFPGIGEAYPFGDAFGPVVASSVDEVIGDEDFTYVFVDDMLRVYAYDTQVFVRDVADLADVAWDLVPESA